MSDTDTETDPKGLMREAYAIEGITPSECRSIFLDWALSLPAGVDANGAIDRILARPGLPEDHPMTRILAEGRARMESPRRRGGWRSRPRN